MLLAIDIGNTSIHNGIFRGRTLKKTFRIPAYAKNLRSRYLRKLRPCMKEVRDVIIVSVVPIALRQVEKIIKKIEDVFCKKGHLLLFVNSYDNPEIEKAGIYFMLEKQADVLLIGSTGENEDYLKRFQQKGLQIIFLDRRAKHHKFPMVYVNKREGMYRAIDYLAKKGHQKIALISGHRQVSSNYDRYMGITDYLYKHELTWRGSISYYFSAFSEQYGYSMMKELVCNRNYPTAIVTGGSIIATGVFLYCRENNLRIPEDISLISFGDFSGGKLIYPRLTYINDEHEKLGNHLIKLIQLAFNKELNDDIEIIIPSQLCVNDSVIQISKTKIDE